MCELENGHRFTLSMVIFHGFFYDFVYQRVSPTSQYLGHQLQQTAQGIQGTAKTSAKAPGPAAIGVLDAAA